MRNLNLDEFWPIMPRRPEDGAPAAGVAPSVAVPPDRGSDGDVHARIAQAIAEADAVARQINTGLSRDFAAEAAQTDSGSSPDDSATTTGVLPPVPPPAQLNDAAQAHKRHAAAAQSDAWDGTADKAPIELDRGSRRDRTPLVWGGLGFVAGALAWHVIGFWSFMSEIVLNAPSVRNNELALPAITGAPARPLTTGSIKQEKRAQLTANAPAENAPDGKAQMQAACIALSLDRPASATQKTECGALSGTPLRDAGMTARADRLKADTGPKLEQPVSATWTSSTAVEVSAAKTDNQPGEPGTLDVGTLAPDDLQLKFD